MARHALPNWTHCPATPLPVSETVCGDPGAPSVIVNVPFTLPVAVGVNVTLTVQLAPDASLGTQLSVSSKFAVVTMLTMFSIAVP